MTKPPNQAQKWFDKAEEDLKAIKILLSVEDTAYGIICYLAQQSAEKYLKGFLTFTGIKPPKIHDLPQLKNLCALVDVYTIENAIKILNYYAIEPRYPMLLQEEYSKEEAQKASELAQEVKGAVMEAIRRIELKKPS